MSDQNPIRPGLERRKLTADSLSPHPKLDRVRRCRLRGVTVWLIQWVPFDVADRPLELANPDSRAGIASILPSRISHARVEEIAKALFLMERAEPTYMLAIYRAERASARAPSASPLTPVYATIETEVFPGDVRRLPFPGRFRIGRDPCLYARRVENLRERENGLLDWDEFPMPRPPGP